MTAETRPEPTRPEPRHRPRRHRGAALLVALAAATTLVAACGTDGGTAGPAAPGEAASASNVAPTEIEIVATDHTFTTSSEVVSDGPVTVTFVNRGSEDHQVHLMRTKPGVDRDQLIAAYERDHDHGVFALVEPMGGVSAAAPGATEQSVSELEPGEYLMVCFIAGPDGRSHIEHGMVVPLTVVSIGEQAQPPAAPERITLKDYAFELPATFAADGTVEVRNEGNEAHELVVLRIKDGKSVNDLAAWGASGEQGPKPFDFAGGLGAIAPGATGWADLDLPPGQYVAVCAIPDATGTPHLDLGMVMPFTI